MLLNVDNPVYNTIIVFSIIMLLLYIIKPDVIYNNEKKEFRQFGTTDGKTLLPIHVVGILLAIILYVFFYYLAQRSKDQKNENELSNQDSIITYHTIPVSHKRTSIQTINQSKKNKQHIRHIQNNHQTDTDNIDNTDNDSYKYYLQQQLQLQTIQNQLNQLVQQQLSSQSNILSQN